MIIVKTIILSYEEGIHFKLIGYFDDIFITKFNKKIYQINFT